jgi:hypothetical protein
METQNDPTPAPEAKQCCRPRRGRLRRVAMLGALFAALAASATALARPRGHGGPLGFMMGRLLHHVDLTEQQEMEAVRIRRALADEGRAARKDAQAALGQAIAELEKPQPDARKLHGAADQAMSRMNAMVHSAIDRLLTLHATFSPEQRKDLTQTLRKHEERMRRHADGDDERGDD